MIVEEDATHFQELPANTTLCQLLAWLFQCNKQGKSYTSDFYQFRNYFPQTKFDIKKTKLREFCQKYSKYLKYSGKTKKEEAYIQATDACNCSDFKEKLRNCYTLNKKAEELWSLVAPITEQEIDKIKTLEFSSYDHRTSLYREWCKRLSTAARDNIMNNEERRTQLLSEFTRLDIMASKLDISTTHLAQALLGYEAFEEKVEITDPIKQAIFDQSKKFCRGDLLFGHLHDKVAIDTMRKNGNYGENLIKIDLNKMGITDDMYQTEQQQEQQPKAAAADALQIEQQLENMPTPDFLFHSPVKIFDKEIRWIEVKNFAVAPDISADKVITRLQRQVNKYEKHFGEGMVLFTKEGFSESLREHLPNALLVTRLPDAKTKERHQHHMRQNIYQTLDFLNSRFMSNKVRLSEGHKLGGEGNRETALARYEEGIRLQNEMALHAALHAEALQLNEEIFDYIHGLFEDPWAVLEDKLQIMVSLIFRYELDGKGRKALKNMKTMVSNVLEHPLEKKYRRFNKDKVVVGIKQATEFFLALGFAVIKDELSDVQYLECDTVDEQKLNLGLKVILDFESIIESTSV